MSSAGAPRDSGAAYGRFLAGGDAGGWGLPPAEEDDGADSGAEDDADSDFSAEDDDGGAFDSDGASYHGSEDSDGSGGSGGSGSDDEERGDEAVSGAPGAAASAGARATAGALFSGAAAVTDDTGGGGLSALPHTEREWSDFSLTSDAYVSEADVSDDDASGGLQESGGEAHANHSPPHTLRPDAPPGPQAAQQPRDAAEEAAGAAPGALQRGIEAFPPSPEGEGGGEGGEGSPDLIARRTRAHVSLVDLELEQLEKCLALDDEADFLFDDSDEYAAFLADLQAPWDALPGSMMDDGFGPGFPCGGDEEDEGDEDYEAVDPAAAAVAAALQGGGADAGGAARRALPPRAPLPPRPARARAYTYVPKGDRPGVRERPLASAVAPLRPLLPAPSAQGGMPSAAMLMPPPPPPAGAVTTTQQLSLSRAPPMLQLPPSTAAAAAAAQSRLIAELLARGAPLPPPEAMAAYIAAALLPPTAGAAAATAPLSAAAGSERSGHGTCAACAPPLAARAPLAPLALAQSAPGAALRPAASAMAASASAKSTLSAAAAAAAAPPVRYAAAFTPVQLRLVRKQLHEHVQLLLQVHGLSARSPLRKHVPAADASARLLAQLAAAREQALRAAHDGMAKYPPALFAGEVAGALYRGPGGQPPEAGDPASACPASAAIEGWWPAVPDSPLSTLLDVPSLAQARAFLNDVAASPPTPLEPEAEAEEQAGPASDFDAPLSMDLDDNPAGPAIATGGKKPRRRAAEPSSLPPVPFAVASALSSRFGHGGICSRALVACAERTSAAATGGAPRAGGAFTRGEDALLATGVHTYGNDYASIAAWLLPHRSALSLAHRVKNVLAGRRRGGGGGGGGAAVRAAREAVAAPLRAPELAALSAALQLLRPGRGGTGAHWPRVAAHVWAAGRVRRPAATLYRLHRDMQTAAAAASATPTLDGDGNITSSVATAGGSGMTMVPAAAPTAQIRPTFLLSDGGGGCGKPPQALSARALIDAPLPPMQRHVLIQRAAARGDLPPPATAMSTAEVAKLMRPLPPMAPQPPPQQQQVQQAQARVEQPAAAAGGGDVAAAAAAAAAPGLVDGWGAHTWMPAPLPQRSRSAMAPPPPRAPPPRVSPRKPTPAPAPAPAAPPPPPKRKGKRSAASRSRAGRASAARARPPRPEFEHDIVPDSSDDGDDGGAAVAAAAALAAASPPPPPPRATLSRGAPPPDSAARVKVAAAALSNLRGGGGGGGGATAPKFDQEVLDSDEDDEEDGARCVRPRTEAGAAAPTHDDGVTAAFASPPASAAAARWQPSTAAPGAAGAPPLQPRSSDAEVWVDGQLTRWSAEEDRALLLAAQAAGGRPCAATFAAAMGAGPLARRSPEEGVARYIQLVNKMTALAAAASAQ